jgi:hypothetical protein
VAKRFGDTLEEVPFGGITYWTARIPERRRDRERPEGEPRLEVRQPAPSFGVVGNYLLFSDRAGLFEQAVLTSKDSEKSLASDLEYKLILSRIKRQPGGDAPGMISFSRPEEAMRMWYDLAVAENTQKLLARQGERNDFFRGVDQALRDNPLPPFSVIQKYLAPGGGFLTSDKSGLHYASFGLKRKSPGASENP